MQIVYEEIACQCPPSAVFVSQAFSRAVKTTQSIRKKHNPNHQDKGSLANCRSTVCMLSSTVRARAAHSNEQTNVRDPPFLLPAQLPLPTLTTQHTRIHTMIHITTQVLEMRKKAKPLLLYYYIRASNHVEGGVRRERFRVEFIPLGSLALFPLRITIQRET